jgi:uncharacterized protein YfbU (UPF0304 family)
MPADCRAGRRGASIQCSPDANTVRGTCELILGGRLFWSLPYNCAGSALPTQGRQLKLTNPEKLILVMLAEIHETLKIKNGVDTELVKSAIHNDNTWALSWELPGIVGDSPDETPPQVNEVAEILEMWTLLEEAYESSGNADKQKIETEAGGKFRFRGFDGNNETELMSIASFFVNDMEKFARFAGRDFNSHMQSIDIYRRMFAVYDPIRATLDGNGLTADQVIQILKAKKHP